MTPAHPLQTRRITGVKSEVRTRFCTATGWHAYRDITPAMRAVILSADGGEGFVTYPKSKRTEDRLVEMGLIEKRGLGFKLTHHGGNLWIEL